ncbi:MAG: radical SAM protein [Actinomycetota bacterium]
MLNVTTLLGGRPSSSDKLRYGHGSALRSGGERRPVVVWNSTRRCNLACAHCYTDSTSRRYENELDHEEALAFIGDIAEFGSPALLMSGGEPLMRERVFELIGHALDGGLSVTLSSNGTLITEDVARRLADLGVRYVGLSLDGLGEVHDRFRGRRGAFEKTMAGIRRLRAVGVPVGIRVTLTPTAIAALPDLFALAEREGVSRACFYHLVPSGRGRGQVPVTPAQAREAVESIFGWAESLVERESPITVLTVDNYSDGPALYLRTRRRDPDQAERLWESLSWNGGSRNASGRGLAAVDWEGNVRPDQFWGGPLLGSIRQRPLSEIWTDPPAELDALRTRRESLTGRCTGCRFLAVCGGGLASRSLGSAGDVMASDPGCVLTDAEIAEPAAV